MRGAVFASERRIAALLLAAPLLLLALAGPALAAQFASWGSLAPSVEPYENPFEQLQEPLRGPQAQMEHRLDDQGALDCGVRVELRSPSSPGHSL